MTDPTPRESSSSISEPRLWPFPKLFQRFFQGSQESVDGVRTQYVSASAVDRNEGNVIQDLELKHLLESKNTNSILPTDSDQEGDRGKQDAGGVRDPIAKVKARPVISYAGSKAPSYASNSTNSAYFSALSGTGFKNSRKIYRLQEGDEYSELLRSKNLWPVDPMSEKNWSGRGQHAEFQKHEIKLLNTILDVQDVLGSTSIAIVQSVRCKRILLARKTIRCNRNFTKNMAIEEVGHLSKLDHSHIVQVIGTYVMGRELSILMYPVAECNLESFLHDLDPHSCFRNEWIERMNSLKNFPLCLIEAVRYIHSKMTKHMDIKPKNILVRDVRRSTVYCYTQFKVYIADFGISRSYGTLDATETDGPTMFTKKYAAPEVVDRETRGLPADIFSLGCVIVEIIAALDHTGCLSLDRPVLWYTEAQKRFESEQNPLYNLQNCLNSNEYGDTSYQANINAVCSFLGPIYLGASISSPFSMGDITQMLSKDPLKRPSAETLRSRFFFNPCCSVGADPLEATTSELVG